MSQERLHQPHDPPDQEEVLRLVNEAERHQVRFVNLEFTDVVGIVKSVTIPVEQFSDCLAHGKWFDGSSIEGFARIAESDMYLLPDLSTFAIIPWSAPGDVTARIICDVLTPSGERYQGDPRAVLRRALHEATQQGFRYVVAPELEFFLLQRSDGKPAPLPHDRGSYFDLSTDLAAAVRREMVSALQAMGPRIETSHHEVAAGQHEIDFEPANALASADAIMTARYALKAIAQQHDLYATFLPTEAASSSLPATAAAARGDAPSHDGLLPASGAAARESPRHGAPSQPAAPAGCAAAWQAAQKDGASRCSPSANPQSPAALARRGSAAAAPATRARRSGPAHQGSRWPVH